MRPAPTTPVNKYNTHARLADIEVVAHSALTEAKRAHERLDHAAPKGDKGDTGAAGLSVRGLPGRDGKDGAPGRDAVGITGPQGASIKGDKGNRGEKGDKGDSIKGDKGDSIKGDRGERGERGDVLIPNESELAAAVIQLRQEKARWLAALAVQLERNSGRKHPGLRSAVASVLSTLKSDSQ